MVIALAILMVILLGYLPSDLQRSPTDYYKYIALLSFRGAFVFLRYFCMLHWIECFLHSIPCRTSIDFSYKLYLDAAKLVFAVLQIASSFHSVKLHSLKCGGLLLIGFVSASGTLGGTEPLSAHICYI